MEGYEQEAVYVMDDDDISKTLVNKLHRSILYQTL
jgi:hypothetical protein